jgi:hypothetical protein
LDKARNCGCDVVGSCQEHGNIKYGTQEVSKDTGKALCPKCQKGLKVPFELVLGKKFRVWRCPVKDVTVEALFFVRLVNWSEEIGTTPNGGALLDETNLYFEIRNVVVYEQAHAHEEFRDKTEPQHSISHDSQSGKIRSRPSTLRHR